jgi:hypothetical protein
MTTPDIAGLCERLRAYGGVYRKEATDTLERQAAEIERLRGALERIAADGQPYRNGYCQTDIGIDPAMNGQEAQEVARAALLAKGAGT